MDYLEKVIEQLAGIQKIIEEINNTLRNTKSDLIDQIIAECLKTGAQK